MAESDIRGNNRFTQRRTPEQTEPNANDILLRIMREEFPDDRFYSQNSLGPRPRQNREGQISAEERERIRNLPQANRNDENVIVSSTEVNRYESYKLEKSYPTLDEDALDDLIDEEWEFFEDPEDEPIVPDVPAGPTGLFLVNAEKDLQDFHSLYIADGPQTIDESSENITDTVFCVFYIQDGVAYAIPTYKTLEVMLVERGKTYADISEATPEQIKDFDLLLDGNFSGDDDYDSEEPDRDEQDDDMTPYDEFIERSMPVRDSDWNYEIRFRSGYLPKAPFVRDPGDYIKADTQQGLNPEEQELYAQFDPDDLYYNQVFQKQTEKERLREKFEGKFVVADWPAPEYIDAEADSAPQTRTDDAGENVRIMVCGHWKQVVDVGVFKLFAYLNDINIANFDSGAGGGLGSNDSRYGEFGLIQLLIDGGGMKVITPGGARPDRNDVQSGNSDIRQGNEPLWNAFPHIVDVDEFNDISGVDLAEYRAYLNNYSNGGKPFDIKELAPYEPKGSLKYYNRDYFDVLVREAIAQAEIDAVKDQIFEIWPEVSALATSVKNEFDALPLNYTEYLNKELGDKSPLFKLWISNKGDWKFVKKKGKKRIKVKQSQRKLFKVCAKQIRIKTNLKEKEEKDLVKKYKWMKTVHRDKFAGWLSNEGTTALGVATGAGVVIATGFATAAQTGLALSQAGGFGSGLAAALSGGNPAFSAIYANPIVLYAGAAVALFILIDKLVGEVEANKYDLPPWRFMREKGYLNSCIFNEISGTVEGFKQACALIDQILPAVKSDVEEIYSELGRLEQDLLNADSVEEFQAVYEQIINLQGFLENLNENGMFAQALQCRIEIDNYVIDQLKRQYNAIQYLRKKVHKKIGNKKKFALVWPKGPRQILNKYVPGLEFDNFQPKGAKKL